MKEVKMRMGRREESWDCLDSCMQVLFGESEEDLRVIVGNFVGV